MMSAKGTNVIRATSFVITIEKKKHNSTSSVTIAFVPWAFDNIFSARKSKTPISFSPATIVIRQNKRPRVRKSI